MSEKLVIFNIGWMKKYEGLQADSIESTAEYINQKNIGLEIYNFLPINGTMYGFVQPSGRANYTDRQIKIERIGQINKSESLIDGVLVAWVARHPEKGGSFLVGWYKNATVYRYYQQIAVNNDRIINSEAIGYYTKAKDTDCVLLTMEERILEIPRAKNTIDGGMGQSNIWYANSGKINDVTFRQQLLAFINNYQPNNIIGDSLHSGEIAASQETLFYEGRTHKILVNAYERNIKAREQCIKHYGYSCFICNFNFVEIYGMAGKDYIHVHHLKPLSEIGEGYVVDAIRDLVPVCPNCHAIIHRRNPAYTLDEMKAFLRENLKLPH